MIIFASSFTTFFSCCAIKQSCIQRPFPRLSDILCCVGNTVGVLIENEREVPVVYVYFIKVLFFVIKSKYFVFKNASNNDLNMRGKVTYV